MEFIHKPHAVCIPLPAQGHINPMLSLAKLLHSRGFYITFVHTEFNYHKLLDSASLESSSVEDFQFETVSDGLPPDNLRGILDLPALACSVPVHTLDSFRQLIKKLNSSPDLPPVSCIVSDGVMGFTLKVAREFGIPEILFFTLSACGLLGYFQFEKLIEKGYFPLKDESYLCNGYLDTTTVEWTTSMGSIRLRDLPAFIRTTKADDILFHYNMESANNAVKTGSLILNTFDELEEEVLDVLKTKFPNLYTVGPLSLLCQQICGQKLESIKSSLWREDEKCLEWLDGKEARSVVYVNYGSLVIMTPKQLHEFAWGLANSKPNLVNGGTEVISQDFLDEIKGRGLILDWCPQEKVLSHPSVGAFLTHCGWNSTLETICHGVPIVCWPFFAEQQMNCLYACTQWGIGMEIDADVERGEVEGLLRELMEGRKGVELKEKVSEWKKRGERASRPGGSSYINFDLLVENLKGGMHSCKH
ncbi:UNVERIFIED_CONTAM: 7-deoxyloganetin glucosyltransferase [Sesamum radiatum]|uniref:Glycosyltransferase n=1 Tax=Sesamum radiatum TaxID=300843 RepID=A0AAW2MTX0_SESRA